jgi:hypothetical protein
MMGIVRRFEVSRTIMLHEERENFPMSNDTTKPGIKLVDDALPELKPTEEPTSIAKPEGFSLEAFRSTRPATAANVATLLTALPHHNMAAAKDFVRLHPNEEKYWSKELCFVNIPIQGQRRDTLHLIREDLAMRFLEPSRILRFRLALATKPYDNFFLCHVPSQRLDNPWNETNQRGCEQAKTLWTEVTSRREEGKDEYKIKTALDKDAFPEPKWPKESLEELIEVTFAKCLILHEDHPGLLRRIGKKQSMS